MKHAKMKKESVGSRVKPKALPPLRHSNSLTLVDAESTFAKPLPLLTVDTSETKTEAKPPRTWGSAMALAANHAAAENGGGAKSGAAAGAQGVQEVPAKKAMKPPRSWGRIRSIVVKAKTTPFDESTMLKRLMDTGSITMDNVTMLKNFFPLEEKGNGEKRFLQISHQLHANAKVILV
jgi:hypothetical protein